MLGYVLGERIFGIDPRTLLDMDNQIELNRTNVACVQFYLGVISIGSFIVASLIVIKTFRKDFFEFSRLNKGPSPINLLIGIGILVCAIPVVNWLILVNGKIELPATMAEFLDKQEKLSNFTYDVMLKGNVGWNVALNILLVGLIPAIGEELFFRGIMMRIFGSWFNNVHIGVWASAIMFATLHAQIYKILPMILMGVMFGYIYYRSGSLWVPILLHFINNSLAVIADHYIEIGVNSPILKDEETFPWYIIVLGGALLTGLFLVLKKRNPNPPELYFE